MIKCFEWRNRLVKVKKLKETDWLNLKAGMFPDKRWVYCEGPKVGDNVLKVTWKKNEEEAVVWE